MANKELDPAVAGIALRLKTRMRELNMHVAELSELSGTTPQQIHSYLDGKTIPSIPTLKNIAYALEIPVAYLMGEPERLGEFLDLYRMQWLVQNAGNMLEEAHSIADLHKGKNTPRLFAKLTLAFKQTWDAYYEITETLTNEKID